MAPARICRRALVLALFAGGGAAPLGSAPGAAEYHVKAAFLCNFVNFIEWPGDDPARPVTIGVLGRDPFGGALEEAARQATPRAIRVRRSSSPRDLLECHIVFIPDTEDNRLEAALKALAEARVLTVGESDRFAARGGIIGFVVIGSKMRFEFNIDAAARAGLRVSSKLLSLARIVRGG